MSHLIQRQSDRSKTSIEGRHSGFGFTLPEVLVVVGVIALLIAVLLPALAGGKKTAQMLESQNKLKQISTWMQLYTSANRETIVPSQFDYSASAATYPVKVRSDAGLGGLRFQGTWTDILWTYNDLGASHEGANEATLEQYRYDSPDKALYDSRAGDAANPFRSTVANSRDVAGGTGPTPFGNGAMEVGLPGFFAANNFFNTGLATGPQKFWTTGQIKALDRSLYVVDSIAGETIEPDPAVFNNTAIPTACQADFRYNGACLMLFLDGHSSPEGPWTDLPDLQGKRRIKVQSLQQN